MLEGTHLQAYKDKLAKTNGVFADELEGLVDDILDADDILDMEQFEDLDDLMEDLF